MLYDVFSYLKCCEVGQQSEPCETCSTRAARGAVDLQSGADKVFPLQTLVEARGEIQAFQRDLQRRRWVSTLRVAFLGNRATWVANFIGSSTNVLRHPPCAMKQNMQRTWKII